MRADTIFTRGEDEMEQRVGAYFGSRVFDIDGVHQLDLNDFITLQLQRFWLCAGLYNEVHNHHHQVQTALWIDLYPHSPVAGQKAFCN